MSSNQPAKTPFDLSGKVALVTGGNGGIGLGFAKALAASGADICIWGRNAQKNAGALTELRLHAPYVKAEALICDVADEQAVNDCFRKTLDLFGRVDTCIANAGVAKGFNRFHEMTKENWRSVLDVNLDGLFYTLRAAAAHMVERAEKGDVGGRLIGVSSLGALCGMARAEHYAGSKGAVISIMQGLAVEYARYGITANSILPGHIQTDMTDRNYQNEKFANAILPRIPMRRWGSPADFGGIAVYLASDASSYHTGDKFLIDGGFFIY
ncbi:MAG: SDR family NAD(P)-dependent oxidoreductase [Pseudohongiella sp.]|nr:SDR family NAD(P)-dependent oxidoreductase [Pseudohongiella sp.]MDO9521282.1 SDR family NAD(P)-dependent oxidoreductase [Pseudohongiella sp.]